MTTTSETPFDKRVADFMRQTGSDPRRVASLYKITPRMALCYYNKYYDSNYNQYAPQLRAEIYAAARAYGESHPNATTKEIAELFNITIDVIYKLKIGCHRRWHNGALQPGEMRRIMDMLKVRPVASMPWYRQTSGRGENVIRKAIGLLNLEGFDYYAIRDKLINDYFKSHPNATYTDAARYFGCPIPFITSVVKDVGRKREEEMDAEDMRLQSLAIDPPPDIQREIDERGGFGVSLPPESMQRFCEHHRRKVAARERAYSLQNGAIYDLERI